MVVETAGKLGFLELGGNVLIRHLMLPCLNQVGFLKSYCEYSNVWWETTV